MNLPFLLQLNPFFEMTSKPHLRRAYYINMYKKALKLEAGMQNQQLELLPLFLERLGRDEEPMGVFFTDEKTINLHLIRVRR